MKRDMDLVRNILFAVEGSDEPLDTDFLDFGEHTPEEVSYHVRMLTAHGLLDSHDDGDYGSPDRIIIDGLTWQGCDYLDAVRDARVWEKTKETVKKAVGSTTMSVIKDTAVKVASKLIDIEIFSVLEK